MSTRTAETSVHQPGVHTRVLKEGYGPGAWHGPDLKAALADVTPELAFWRVTPGRHNIAEIAIHHAYYARVVRERLSGQPAEPFVFEGDDWFELNDGATLPWADILATVEREQQRLAELVAAIESATAVSPMAESERFDTVLGITCHAVYHAGQIQLIRRLRGAS